MAFPTAYHADSDADDEYERTEMTSPILPTDDDTSPTDSDPPSTEPTPTFGRSDTEKLSPGNAILQWTAEQCVDYVASLGLPQYCDRFLGRSDSRRRKFTPWKKLTSLISTRERDCWRSLDRTQARRSKRDGDYKHGTPAHYIKRHLRCQGEAGNTFRP